jgi:hypothetical protein
MQKAKRCFFKLFGPRVGISNPNSPSNLMVSINQMPVLTDLTKNVDGLSKFFKVFDGQITP